MPTKAAAKKRAPRAETPTVAPAGPAAPIAAEAFRPTLHADIRPDPRNPRKIFDEDGLQELAASIARDDLLEPLVIRPIEGEADAFMLIAGERRWRAIGLAIEVGTWPADKPVPAMLRAVGEEDARRLALVENLQRRDLNAVEEARALLQLQELTGKSAAEIGRELGFTERWAQQRLALLKLPEGVQGRIERGELKVEDGRKLVALLPKLPAVQQVAIEAGKLSVAEAEAWLAKQPKPLDLSDEEWILALEVFDKVATEPLESGGRSTECHADARFDERVKALSQWPAYLLHEIAHVLDDGGETGRFQVSAGYRATEQLELKFGKEISTERGRLRALDALYANVGAAHTPPLYRTTWLNGPFEISNGLRQEIAAARVERAEREAAWKAERAQEDATRARMRQAHIDRLNAVRQEATTIATAKPDDRPSALLALAQLGGHRLPWSLDGNGSIVDADGGIVQRNAHWQLSPEQQASLQLIIALANAGAGLTPPEPMAESDDEPLPRDEFVRIVANCLTEDCDDLPEDGAEALFEATARTGRGLDAFLTQEAIEYGDRAYAWDDEAAMAVAEGIRVDGLGQQIDLEEAIAAAPEPKADEEEIELTPALLALAGVGRR